MNDALSTPIARLVALVERELQADEVRIVDEGDEGGAPERSLEAPLPDGRRVVATFTAMPADREVAERRLGVIVATFAQTLDEAPASHRPSRPPVAHSLHEELRALTTRAWAIDALIIDAHSPVLWGSAALAHHEGEDDSDSPVEEESLRMMDAWRQRDMSSVRGIGDETEDDSGPVSSDTLTSVPAPAAEQADPQRDYVRRALREIRALPETGLVSKGRPLRHSVRSEQMGVIAHSFAGIYILVLVFDQLFDEMRAQRAIVDALPRIEPLVLALPPLDPAPAPMANVVRLRRRARR